MNISKGNVVFHAAFFSIVICKFSGDLQKKNLSKKRGKENLELMHQGPESFWGLGFLRFHLDT